MSVNTMAKFKMSSCLADKLMAGNKKCANIRLSRPTATVNNTNETVWLVSEKIKRIKINNHNARLGISLGSAQKTEKIGR